MNHQEIVKYVKETIRSGNKDRIVKVMNRYIDSLKKPDMVEYAKELFGVTQD